MSKDPRIDEHLEQDLFVVATKEPDERYICHAKTKTGATSLFFKTKDRHGLTADDVQVYIPTPPATATIRQEARYTLKASCNRRTGEFTLRAHLDGIDGLADLKLTLTAGDLAQLVGMLEPGSRGKVLVAANSLPIQRTIARPKR